MFSSQQENKFIVLKLTSLSVFWDKLFSSTSVWVLDQMNEGQSQTKHILILILWSYICCYLTDGFGSKFKHICWEP